jgi:hypothetical protein
MDISFFFTNNLVNKNKGLVSFLTNQKIHKFTEVNYDNLKEKQFLNILCIIDENLEVHDFLQSYENISKINFKNIIYLASKRFNNFLSEKNENKILYPIHFAKLLKGIESVFENKITLDKKIFISGDGFLFNSENDKKVYLTEIETKLITLLIKNNSVTKERINEFVLGQNANVDSKSFDTHLYRLRSKVTKISENIKIKQFGEGRVKLVYLI